MSELSRKALREAFGYEEFRPFQERIIDAVLAGEDVLAVMPTGGGKSLCYQVPALALGPGALVLVISPLIALMREQVAFLKALGIEAGLLNSTLDPEEWRANAEAAAEGRLRLLYLAPETLASPRASGLFERCPVSLLAVDEAHCISEWGHDFRPEYRMLGEIRNKLIPRQATKAAELSTAASGSAARASSGSPRVPCLALTATATERVRSDIVKQLGLGAERPLRDFVAGFDRPNIFLEVRRRGRAVDQILELASAYPEGAGIVYCFSRSRAEALAAELSERGLPALPYHAGLPDETRSANQDAFIRDETRVVCATTAFGMGIDKPDVRFVAHADLPKSLEQYYQEIGRAGRDGLPARALLLYSYGDAVRMRSFLADRVEDSEAAEDSLRAMLRYAEGTGCRRAALLSHFGEAYHGPAGGEAPEGGATGGCGACDVCVEGAHASEESDVTTQAYKFLSCVKRTGERYGAGHVVDVLLGSRNERVLGLGHAELSTWGIGKEWAKNQWLDLAIQLVRKGYLAKDEEYGVLSLTPKTYQTFRDKSAIRACVAPRSRSRVSKTASSGLATAASPSREAVPEGLEARLRALRRRLAAEGGVAPYMVFSDRTLYDLIAKAPADEAALLEVFGMGEIKARRFGAEILSVTGPR